MHSVTFHYNGGFTGDVKFDVRPDQVEHHPERRYSQEDIERLPSGTNPIISEESYLVTVPIDAIMNFAIHALGQRLTDALEWADWRNVDAALARLETWLRR